MTSTTQQSRTHSWLVSGITIAVIALVIAVVTSCGSASIQTRTVTVATAPASAPDPPTATLNFTPTHLANGAHGTVTATPSGKADIRLTISVVVPNTPTYGIALWSDKQHWTGLYTGTKGTNSQTMAISPETLVRYKLLEVGLQVIRGHVSRHHGIRLDRRSVHYHDLMYISTGELLNKLVAAKAQ